MKKIQIDIDNSRGWLCSECGIIQTSTHRDSMFIIRKESSIHLLCPVCNNLHELEKLLEEKENQHD